MAPHIQRFEVAAKFGGRAVYNAEGSAAMAELIKKMADIIDEEIINREAIREEGRKAGEAYRKLALRDNAAILREVQRERGWRHPDQPLVTALYRAHRKGR